MGINTLEFHQVSFHHPNQVQHLFSEIHFSLGPGWNALIGANGAGKSTLLKLASGELEPLSGSIFRPEHAIYLSQRTDAPPQGYDEFANSWDGLSCKLHGQFGLSRDVLWHWDSLSHGERKRAQIGWALYQESDVLCIDEPTNHLDNEGLSCIKQHLASYKGIGLLVSHDLDLLDQLCSKTVLVHAPYISILSCPPSQALATISEERESLQSAYLSQRNKQTRLQTEIKK